MSYARIASRMYSPEMGYLRKLCTCQFQIQYNPNWGNRVEEGGDKCISPLFLWISFKPDPCDRREAEERHEGHERYCNEPEFVYVHCSARI